MVLRSRQFDDVYFSADDGMAETHHVFLEGNNLPAAWQGKDEFTIAETGFGTGLNFLCAWKMFEETAEAHQRLNFISVEKYPLSKGEIKDGLSPWDDVLGDYINQYLAKYPIRVPGPHAIAITNRVTLTVWFGDVADVMPNWMGRVDAWFLDGFTPAKNPEMWNEELYKNMARLSHGGTTLATFTAAGDVRRGLGSVGFEIEKTKGFGRKRDMVRGRFDTIGHPEFISGSGVSEALKQVQGDDISSIAIIGGGLAGCGLAYMAHRQGVKATIYEVGERLAVGASGGQKGMVNPKLTAKPTAQSDYYTAAYANALRVLADMNDIDFQIHGSRHICTDDDKNRRFTGYVENLGWHADHIYRDRDGDDVVYPDGASVCPEKLCHTLAKHADVYLNTPVCHSEFVSESGSTKILKQIQDAHDCVILANGHAVNELLNDDLPVNWVRGQVSWVKPQADVTHNIMYGGYVTPETPEGYHVLGSTLDPKNDNTTLRDEDHQEVLNRYNNKMNKNLTMDDVVGGWSALRTSSKDRFPVVGKIDDRTYISTAHGSHGIISSLYAAQILLSLMRGAHLPLTRDVLRALSPERFRKH